MQVTPGNWVAFAKSAILDAKSLALDFGPIAEVGDKTLRTGNLHAKLGVLAGTESQLVAGGAVNFAKSAQQLLPRHAPAVPTPRALEGVEALLNQYVRVVEARAARV